MTKMMMMMMMMVILITANIFGKFTTCQALGLELYRYYSFIFIPAL